MIVEKCNECGRSVKIGSGFFVGRIIDLNDYDYRKIMNKPFPEGDYICSECDISRDMEINKSVREYAKRH